MVTNIAAGRVVMAFGGTLLATKILIPFAKIIACAATGGVFCFVGYHFTTVKNI